MKTATLKRETRFNSFLQGFNFQNKGYPVSFLCETFNKHILAEKLFYNFKPENEKLIRAIDSKVLAREIRHPDSGKKCAEELRDVSYFCLEQKDCNAFFFFELKDQNLKRKFFSAMLPSDQSLDQVHMKRNVIFQIFFHLI